MPVVIMKQGKSCEIHPEILYELANQLPSIVANALDVPEDDNARLTASDIEVWHSSPGHLDRNTKPLALLIVAHGYEKRVVNLEERKNKIVEGVSKILGKSPSQLGWVWIFTGETSFGRI